MLLNYVPLVFVFITLQLRLHSIESRRLEERLKNTYILITEIVEVSTIAREKHDDTQTNYISVDLHKVNDLERTIFSYVDIEYRCR